MPDLLSISTWRNMFTRMGRGCGWALAAAFAIPLVIGFSLSQYGRGGNTPNPAVAQNTPIATVNGEPITAGEFNQMAAQMGSRGSEPGMGFAMMQGRVLNDLITTDVLIQEAKKRGLRVAEGDIDSAIAKARATLGKDISDAQWEENVQQRFGMTASEFREALSKQLLIPALQKSIKDGIQVTEDDAKKQYAEVKYALVVIPAANGPIPPGLKGPKPLPDAEAKKKAEDLLAKVKAGADIGQIARANSSDPTASKGGVSDWRPEYRGFQGAPPQFGTLFMGKDFDEAIHKTEKGQLTEVVKVTGLGNGYAFAKVLDRRTNLPKDFDAKKEVENVKNQKAGEAFQKLITDLVKNAKIEILDPDKKAYYDYYMVGAAETPEERQKKQEAVEAEFEAMLKRHPDDDTAALIVAQSLEQKRFKAPPAERDQIRDRLIQLYEVVLRHTENRDIRFKLADLYREKKQDDKALEQYQKIAKFLGDAPPYDLNTMQEAQQVYRHLIVGFNSVNKPDEAKKAEAKVKELTVQIAAEQKKQAQQAPPPMTLPGGGTGTVTLPATGGKPAQAPATGTADKGAAPAKPAAAAPTTPAKSATGAPAAPNAAAPTAPSAGKSGP